MKDLEGHHPTNLLLGFVAPPEWHAIGSATAGRAYDLDDRAERTSPHRRVHTVTLVSRTGEVAQRTVVHDDPELTARLNEPDEEVAGEQIDLLRLALELPTEAQWERAARAGTQMPWWTGPVPLSLQGAANLADLSVERAGGQWPQIERWLDDGFYRHGPVDLLRANPFGLHGVHGNVWEGCRDDFGAYELAARAGDGLRTDAPPGLAVGRGGGFVNNAAYCRDSLRDARPDAPHALFGLRPARALER
jgi:formylglycine-generating enzyme required for sulfatase activity